MPSVARKTQETIRRFRARSRCSESDQMSIVSPELMGTLLGIDFAACYAARVQVELDGVPVNFIDLANLKKSKLAAGRAQDLADLEALE